VLESKKLYFLSLQYMSSIGRYSVVDIGRWWLSCGFGDAWTTHVVM